MLNHKRKLLKESGPSDMYFIHTLLAVDELQGCMISVVTQFLTHLFDKISRKFKNSEKQRKSKKIRFFFYIFASFLVFSASSQKNLIWQTSFEHVQLFTRHF
jgi:hypothetical protein